MYVSLGQLLKHHVVPGAIQSSALQNNGVMQSLLSTPLRVKFYESEDSEWRPLKVNARVHLMRVQDFGFFVVLQSESDLLCGLRSSRLVFNPFPNSSLLETFSSTHAARQMKKHIKITLKIENSRWSFSLLLTLGLYAESPVPTFFFVVVVAVDFFRKCRNSEGP